MRALYLHGFLGSLDDMRPLFLEGVQCESVSVLNYLNQPTELMKKHKGTYDYAVGYSYGGRLLAKCLEIDPGFVKTSVFCSSRVSAYSKQELVERRGFQEKLIKIANHSVDDFYEYWDNLRLFKGHRMKDFRKRHAIPSTPWGKAEILDFLKNHFTYTSPKLEKFKSWYFYGERDYKYKKQGLNMKTHEFKGHGHRFLFEDSKLFKSVLNEKVNK